MVLTSSKKMVRMVARKRRVNRRPLLRLSRPLRSTVKNVYRFKRQGQTSFISWVYSATNGITVNTSGLFQKGAPITSTLSSIGGLPAYYDVGLSQWFQLSDVATPSDFTNLYDRYRITGVKLEITYLDNTAAVNGLSVFPMLNYAIDYDDNNVPTSEGYMQQKQDVKTKALIANKPIKIFIKNPRAISAIQNTLGTFDAGLVTKGYINCDYPTVKHNGMKYWISSIYSNSNSQACIRIVPTYYITCKDPQ